MLERRLRRKSSPFVMRISYRGTVGTIQLYRRPETVERPSGVEIRADSAIWTQLDILMEWKCWKYTEREREKGRKREGEKKRRKDQSFESWQKAI
jgi:hypothetical protein